MIILLSLQKLDPYMSNVWAGVCDFFKDFCQVSAIFSSDCMIFKMKWSIVKINFHF